MPPKFNSIGGWIDHLNFNKQNYETRFRLLGNNALCSMSFFHPLLALTANGPIVCTFCIEPISNMIILYEQTRKTRPRTFPILQRSFNSSIGAYSVHSSWYSFSSSGLIFDSCLGRFSYLIEKSPWTNRPMHRLSLREFLRIDSLSEFSHQREPSQGRGHQKGACSEGFNS